SKRDWSSDVCSSDLRRSRRGRRDRSWCAPWCSVGLYGVSTGSGRSVSGLPPCQRSEPLGELGAPDRLPRHDEYGVIPGDRADHVVEVRAVHRAGQEVRGARRSTQYREAAAVVSGDQELTEQPSEAVRAPGAARDPAAVLRDDVPARSPVGGPDLDGPELVQVATEGGDGDCHALLGERVGEFGLTPDRAARED